MPSLLGPTVVQEKAPSNLKMLFVNELGTEQDPDDEQKAPLDDTPSAFYPPPIIEMSEEESDRFKNWLEEQLQTLLAAHADKEREFSLYKEAYRARPQQGRFAMPFAGACDDNIPVIAMAVDPVQARLDVEILGQKPTFTIHPLRKGLADYKDALEEWVQFWVEHKWKLRRLAAPRLFEMCTLGTMVFKTMYHREETTVRTYQRTDKGFEEKNRKELRYSGPKIVGVPRGDVYFPPGYNDPELCPIIAERVKPTLGMLRVWEESKQITNVDKITAFKRQNLSEVEDVTQQLDNLQMTASQLGDYELWEIKCDYDIKGTGSPEKLVVLYHRDKRVFLMCRYNWYFNQKKQYVFIPYTVVDGTLDGLGLAEMIWSFQIAITRWHRMASDNAYLANTRLFVAKKNSGIEESPRIYAGRTFFVDDPSKDFRPFQAGDIYPSTMVERQNLFGMVEKRSGVSDYLTGRESPILGDRATATSTVALINEGTKRVRETLENIRTGFAEVIENCFYIWAQYGTDGLEDIVWAGEDTGAKVKEFFELYSDINMTGAFAVSLRATDAGENKAAKQQIQLQLINILMTYFERLLQAGEAALIAIKQGLPEYAAMVEETMTKARKMFSDMLKDYDYTDPDAYLPDLARLIAQSAQAGLPVPGGPGGASGPAAGAGGQPGVADVLAALQGAGGAGSAANGSGTGSPFSAPLTGPA